MTQRDICGYIEKHRLYNATKQREQIQAIGHGLVSTPKPCITGTTLAGASHKIAEIATGRAIARVYRSEQLEAI